MNIDNTLKIILSAIPPAVFLYLYCKRIGEKKHFPVYAESFLHGVFVSLIILLFNSFTHEITVSAPLFIRSFVLAASVEKVTALISIYILVRGCRNLSVKQGICIGIIFGAAFGFVENIQYSIAYSADILFQRMFFSVPMHIITCGMIGYFLSLWRIYVKDSNRIKMLSAAVISPVLLHGLFDFVLFSGLHEEIIIPLIIITMIIILEGMISMALTIPSVKVLADKKLGYEEWSVIRRHQRHEKWILRTMGKSDNEYTGLIRFQSGISDVIIAAVMIAAAIVFMIKADRITALTSLRLDTSVIAMIFVSFPLIIAASLLLKGIINPKYFTDGMLRIPIIANAVIYPYSEDEETFITYDITHDLVFLKTYEFPDTDTFDMMFEAAHTLSPIITVKKRWENRSNPSCPFGVLVTPVSGTESARMKLFIRRYLRIKYINGILYGLGVPGREKIKKHFIRTDSVMKQRICFEKGSCIYQQNDKAKYFYCIQSGKVKISFDSDERSISYILKRGEYFGESDVIGERIRRHTAIAESDCELLAADLSEIKTLVENDPHFSYLVILSLSRIIKLFENKKQ
ncbi:MAG TPA: PrsW family glutamic-type intramembrane protease [Spirochaetota bacterium]|nr:PrsW family glutamic-type intramembrane protease [Spirochaetota bacterium]HQA53436.1 PrsW family glutamic-type intramembrane protease [Spirochaetota bacterium]